MKKYGYNYAIMKSKEFFEQDDNFKENFSIINEINWKKI